MKRLIRLNESTSNIEVNIIPYPDENVEGEGHFESYSIEATLDGEEVGSLTLFVYQDYPGEEVSWSFKGETVSLLYFEDFEVNKDSRGKGVANAILKKFGELYNEKFKGWPLYNMYINPIAEYAVLNAISKGWLPQEALMENYTKRGLAYMESKDLLVDLRNKLPEDYRDRFAPGPGGAWDRNK